MVPEVLDYWGRRESDRIRGNDGSPFNNSPHGDGWIEGSLNDPWLKRIKGLWIGGARRRGCFGKI